MIKNLSKKNYSKKSVETFYTKIQIKAEKDSNSGNEPYQYKEFNRYFYKNFSKKFKKNIKILDAGCGFFGGFLPFLYKNNYKKLYACDINTDTIKNLKKNYKFINVSKASCLKMPYKNSEFDFTICYGVIHHTHNYKLALKELNRITKKNGYIFIGIYAFYDSIFEYLIKFLRIVGNIIKFNQMFVIAKRWPLFNRFVMDHTYVPILYLINRKDLINSSLQSNWKLIDEFPSKTDFFQKIPIFGKLFTGDGLLRIFVFKK